MMLSQLMSDCKQSDTRKFAAGMVHAWANPIAAQPARSNFQQPSAGLFSVIQIADDLNSGSPGLLRRESPDPLRT